MVKLLFAILALLTTSTSYADSSLADFVFPKQRGCCSWHGGVGYCDRGHLICADGWTGSSCSCSGGSTGSGGGSTRPPSYTNLSGTYSGRIKVDRYDSNDPVDQGEDPWGYRHRFDLKVKHTAPTKLILIGEKRHSFKGSHITKTSFRAKEEFVRDDDPEGEECVLEISYSLSSIERDKAILSTTYDLNCPPKGTRTILRFRGRVTRRR